MFQDSRSYMSKVKNPVYYGWVIVLASFSIAVVVWGAFWSFGVFFDPVLTEFGWTKAMTSGAMSVCALLMGLLGIPMGTLTDKYGPRLVMVMGGFFLGAGYILISSIRDLWHLYLFYGILVAIGMAAAYIPLVSTAARWFTRKRGMATGIIVSGIGMGTLFMAPFARWLIASYGWRTSYLVVGSLVLAVTIPSACFLRRDPDQMGLLPYGAELGETGPGAAGTGGLSLKDALRTWQFFSLSCIAFLFIFCEFSVMVHISSHIARLGVGLKTGANVLALIGGVGIVGRAAMGSFADKVGNRVAMVTGLALLFLTLIWFQRALDVWALYLFGAAFGFGYGGLFTLLPLMSADLFGLQYHGFILGVILTIGTIGGAFGSVITGKLFDTTGSYYLGMGLCAAFAFIALLLATCLTRSTHGMKAVES